jgi:uncharacterized damage-inducible protein DinB
MSSTATAVALSTEHEELLATLATHRSFLRHTVRDLTDEQARLRPTVSELCLGGLVKHVAAVETAWIRFVTEGPSAVAFGGTEAEIDEHWGQFQMLPGDTLQSVLDHYDEVAAHTAEVVAASADLSASQPLPEAPWFEPGARWSVRRVVLHLIAETAQHAGHADILRESLDGAKTMG